MFNLILVLFAYAYHALITTSLELHNGTSCRFTFGSMALLTGSRTRKQVAAGFNMAVEDYKNGDLNDNKYLNIQNIANACSITTNMADMESDIKVGIVKAFEFGQSYERNDRNLSDINIPLIIGPPTSGYSQTLNPLFAAFNLLQFSTTATSTALSDYPQFFRSVPSDDLQANALIQLCKYFEWKSIGIMYMNSDYGSSLQQALTSYADLHQITTTAFGYIDGDAANIANAVESMKRSRIYIHILIAYGSSLEHITSEIIVNNMNGYPYYFLGTDSILGNIGDDVDNLDIYGGIIGTCPWSPSLDDAFANKYPFPINESIQMFAEFNTRWNQTYHNNDTRYRVLRNQPEPNLWTGYGYDNVLTVIQSINRYISLYGWDVLHVNNEDITSRFQDILHSIWFVGLTGNISYDMNGDRENGLFAFCNVDPESGTAETIGYVIDNRLEVDDDLVIEIGEELIQWPPDYVKKHMIPKYEYIKYDGIPRILLIIVWCCCVVSIVFTIFCILCLFHYRLKPVIKSSQWRLSCVMTVGLLIAYATIMVYGLDETFYSVSYNWNLFCNIRILLFNFAFGLSFGPLFFKVYRIKTIFTVGQSLKRQTLTDTKMATYNLIYVLVEFVLCLLLIIIIPLTRSYQEAEQYDVEKEFYGNCTSGEFWWIYSIILVIPKFVLCIYAMIISIAVYNSVSMMKFNEGLQILIAVVVSVIFIFILMVILSVLTINSKNSATFAYGFLSLILWMLSNFCLVVMLLPRLMAIWTQHEEEVEKEDEKLQKNVQSYLKRMRKIKRTRGSTMEASITNRKSNTGTVETPIPEENIDEM